MTPAALFPGTSHPGTHYRMGRPRSKGRFVFSNSFPAVKWTSDLIANFATGIPVRVRPSRILVIRDLSTPLDLLFFCILFSNERTSNHVVRSIPQQTDWKKDGLEFPGRPTLKLVPGKASWGSESGQVNLPSTHRVCLSGYKSWFLATYAKKKKKKTNDVERVFYLHED